MNASTHKTVTLPGKQLALIGAGALAAATAIVVCFILPAEFQIDPTGMGKRTGLSALGAPLPQNELIAATGIVAAHSYPVAYRTDIIDIPLAAGGDPERKDEVEYKVKMKAGDSLVYSWSVDGVPTDDEFYYDFHGETPAGPGGKPAAKVIEYKQATGRADNGSLVAPIPGVHGWYLQNQSAGRVSVKLKISGFYTLVPPGDYGNQGALVPGAPPAGT